MMDMVTEHLTKYRLQINHNKSAVVVYGPGRKENRQYKMGSLVIPLKEDYKYLGMIIQNASWTKTKESMARKASKAMSWSWNLLMRLGAPTVRAMVSVWTALVRPLLEYGAEIWPGENSQQWKEADALQRKMAKRILDCRRTMPNEVVLGELGWPVLQARRVLLRLFFWAKLTKMDDGRWVKRTYRASRLQAEKVPGLNNWASCTRLWLYRMNLGHLWEQEQEVKDDTRAIIRGRVREYFENEWRNKMQQKPKLEGYRAVKDSLNLEHYLASKDTTARKKFTTLRSGAGLLRVETGRREKLAREDRTCLVCASNEVEDPGHFMLRCPAYRQDRKELFSYVELRSEVEEDLLDYAIKANRDIDGIRDSRIEGELIAFISGENYYNRTLEFVGKACRIRKAALG